MLKKKKLRSFLIISIFLHIVLISVAALIYKSNVKLTFSRIFEISTIKIDSTKQSFNTTQKSDVVNVDSIRKAFAKKPLSKRSKVEAVINHRKDISKKPNFETHTEQNNRIDNVSIANIETTDKKGSKNQLLNLKAVTQNAYPDYKSNPKPRYPMIARRKGYEGTVRLRVYVLENGDAGAVELEKSSNYEILDRSAIEAINRWIFIPGKRNGVPVASWVTVPVKFRLTNT